MAVVVFVVQVEDVCQRLLSVGWPKPSQTAVPRLPLRSTHYPPRATTPPQQSLIHNETHGAACPERSLPPHTNIVPCRRRCGERETSRRRYFIIGDTRVGTTTRRTGFDSPNSASSGCLFCDFFALFWSAIVAQIQGILLRLSPHFYHHCVICYCVAMLALS